MKKSKTKKGWGFDTTELSSVRPQDDLFEYVNRTWIDAHPIPKEESRWGSFIVLRHKTETQVKTIVEQAHDQKIRDLYRSGMDMKRRNALGATPLNPLLARVQKIENSKDLIATLAYFETIDAGGPWRLMVDQDMKDSAHYILYIEQSGLGMPDRDYYLKDGPEQKRVRAAYQKHIAKLITLLGKSPSEARAAVASVMRFETRLARASMDKVSLRDPDKVYHKKTLAQLASLTPHLDWKAYFKIIDAKKLKHLIVSQPQFIAEVGRMMREVPLEEWKTYLMWKVVNGPAPLLSRKFVDASFEFYGKTLTGSKALKPLWRRVLMLVNGSLGEAVGKLYVEKHFPPRAKRRMDMLINDLFAAYETRIKGLDWMTPTTKKKALVKLRAMNRKIGYPTKWKSYKSLEIRAHDYFGNALRVDRFNHARAMRKIGKPIQRHEWHMTPQTVNAYFAPTMNEIVFPAAILQPPFFDASADAAVNYGAIGAVIGHEITHGFDDQGAKFDAQGNLKSWWTKADTERFKKKSARLAAQFDRYSVAPGIYVNGKLTLGENIADLGGASIAYDAYMRYLAQHPDERRDIDGLSPEQRFFIAFAVFEREQSRSEFIKMQVATDPHSPPRFRINGPASNLNEFYKAFNVKKGDALYRKSKDRVKIW